MDILKIKYTKPIEREYEGWIINCIESYFLKINKQVKIFALSPTLEAIFPADEVLSFNFKIIGLQFKKASLSVLRSEQTNADYTNIHWILNNPRGQFELVKNTNEIFYCLPTFINRKYKDVSLEHCLFWRPKDSMITGTYWYNNQNAINEHLTPAPMRWGEFIENIYQCHIGNLYTARQLTRELIINSILRDTNRDVLEGLYAIVLEL